MALTLEKSNQTNPKIEIKTGYSDKSDGVLLKTCSDKGCSFMTIGMDDFCKLVEYVMTNTEIKEEDPRLKLIEFMKEFK
jgi:hypothetical protein